MESKNCGTCKITKNKSEFYKNKGSKDGLCSKCKKCSSEYGKKWQKNFTIKAHRYNESISKNQTNHMFNFMNEIDDCPFCGITDCYCGSGY